MGTQIEWTDETWNPVTGCDHVSPGCDNCYIERTVPFRVEGRRFDDRGRMGVRLHEDRIEQPLHWRKPRRVFVCSLADLFHPDVPDEFIWQVFGAMGAAHQHTFQVLTKRPQRMAQLLDGGARWHGYKVLSNVWLGTSVENQRYADLRIPHLLATPAAVRFLSIEPLLGPVNIARWLVPVPTGPGCGTRASWTPAPPGVDWVIVGGESGPGARPMHPDWARNLRDQCVAAGAPFFFKQWGEWEPIAQVYDEDREQADVLIDDGTVFAVENTGDTPHRMYADDSVEVERQPAPDLEPWWMRRVGKKAAGRELDGRMWDEMPEAVQ